MPEIINRTPYAWKRLYLVNGEGVDGPFTFASDGTIGAYPRYVRKDGVTIPFHAVAVALPAGETGPIFID